MTQTLKNLGLGMLSWYGYDMLKTTLDSYKNAGILELFEEKIIFFQEIDEEGRALAQEYGFEAFGNDKNIGIYGGTRTLVECMKSEYVLVLENDMQFIGDLKTAVFQISTGLELVKSQKVVKASLINGRLSRLEKDCKRFNLFFPPPHYSQWKKLVAAIRRIIKREKALGQMGDVVDHMDNAHRIFDFVKYDEKLKFFFISSKYRMFKSQAIIIERQFYIDTILNQIEKMYCPKKILINGYKPMDSMLQRSHRFHKPPLYYIMRHKLIAARSWWSQQEYPVAVVENGLFVHDRIGYRGYS